MSLQASGNKIPAVGGDLPAVNPTGQVNKSSSDFGNLLTDAAFTYHAVKGHVALMHYATLKGLNLCSSHQRDRLH